MKIADSAKWFTQRITGILVVALVLLTGFLLAQVLRVVGFLALNDGLFYQNTLLWFWVVLVTSRLAFMAAWGILDWQAIDRLHKGGWFWFPPERPSYHRNEEESIDKSNVILVIVTATAFAIVIGEAAIRFATWAAPTFYLSPSQ